MPLQIIRQDITKFRCDAIVNAAKETLLGGGGVDGAIHRAAGPKLLEECRTLGGCPTGQSKITKGYRLPCKYVIHTVGPVWRGGAYGERELLESCYRTALNLAAEYKCESVAFPLISSGIFGYPKAEALRVAADAIAAFLAEHDMTVYLTIFDKSGYQISKQLFADVQSYIDDHYVEEHTDTIRERARREAVFPSDAAPQDFPSGAAPAPKEKHSFFGSLPFADAVPKEGARSEGADIEESASIADRDKCADIWESAGVADKAGARITGASLSLEDMLEQIDESFSQMLLRKIDERGMTDAQCYKKANIDRKLFSKIRSDVHYRPSKPTAVAFAIALELSLDEAKDMLMKAGYALSHSSKFDIIIEYFLVSGNYDIFEINETLFAFDQSLLGGATLK